MFMKFVMLSERMIPTVELDPHFMIDFDNMLSPWRETAADNFCPCRKLPVTLSNRLEIRCAQCGFFLLIRTKTDLKQRSLTIQVRQMNLHWAAGLIAKT